MRIATNSVTNTMVRQIQNLSSQEARLQGQISSGQRITLPEDDPAAVARVLNLTSERRQLTQYSANATQALNVANYSYSGLQSFNALSDRASQIATLGNSTLSADDAKSYADEVNQMIEQAVQTGNTQLNGNYIYSGTKVDTAPFSPTRDVSGNITAVTYEGNGAQTSIPLSSTSSVSPGTSAATNTGLNAFIGNLISLRDGLQSGDTAAVATAQTNLISSGNVIVSAVAENGGIQSRIDAMQKQQTDRVTSIGSLISGESSTDLTTAVVQLSQMQTAYQAALQSASKIMETSLLTYIPTS
jgi:flagellar hook-associated protein 3 FlgL